MSKFKTEQSSTPAAGPKGALNRANLVTQALPNGEAELPDPESGGTCQRRPPGDAAAVSGPALTPRKDRPINFTLPKIKGPENLAKALGAILEAVAQGEITPEEGQTLTAMLEAYRKGLETADFEARLTALERRMLPG